MHFLSASSLMMRAEYPWQQQPVPDGGGHRFTLTNTPNSEQLMASRADVGCVKPSHSVHCDFGRLLRVIHASRNAGCSMASTPQHRVPG